jgi:hypothetical protein
MAELVDALLSGSSAARRGGSSPLQGTIFKTRYHLAAKARTTVRQLGLCDLCVAALEYPQPLVNTGLHVPSPSFTTAQDDVFGRIACDCSFP